MLNEILRTNPDVEITCQVEEDLALLSRFGKGETLDKERGSYERT